jgi:HlyD family secretion protein
LKFPFVVVLSALLIAGCGKGAAPEAPAEKPSVEVAVAHVTRGSIRSTLSVTGVLSPLPDQEAKVSPLAPGRIKQMLVKTGDLVHRGQVIATLDPGAATGQVTQAQAAVKVAEATLNQSRLNLTLQKRTQSSSVEQAKLNVQAQTLALQKLRAGLRPQEVAQAQAALTTAQIALTNAEQSLSRAQTLFNQGLISRKDLEAAQAQEQTAKAAVTSAEQGLSLAKQGSRPEDIRAGEVALQQAQQQLRAAEAQDVQNNSKEQDVHVAQGQLNLARGALQSAIAQSHALTITSPLTGTIVGRGVNPGESVEVTTGVATVVNLDRLRLLLNVPAEQVASLTKGNSVEFTADINPTVKHQARITVINRATDPTTNTVQVEAVTDNADRTLRDDGFVKATIVTQMHSGALLIPSNALVLKDDKTTVYLAGDDGVAHAVEVKTGARDGDQVEVVEGLKAGQAIITTGAFELDDGTKIKVAK